MRFPPWIVCLAVLAGLAGPQGAQAMPVFARQYEISCNVCHAAFPRLNAFGEQFMANNLRMPDWREKTTVDTKDEMLALPKTLPLALRAQAFVQGREGEEVAPGTGPTGNDANFDFQAPYLIKLLSSAPLSDHITYYFYGIFAEKGDNGTTLIEDAWFRHDDSFGTGIGTQLGQFQISDLMFPREMRMTFQDFQVYRMAGITYDRGVLFDRAVGPVDISIGAMNGNGIEASFGVNSPGYRRPDRLFDNDTGKTLFGRIGAELAGVSVGIFGLTGEQKSASGALGQGIGTRDTNMCVYGVDVSGNIAARTYWFAQALVNNWDEFLDIDPDREYTWTGGFVGIDFIHSDRWAYSALYNYNDAGDFAGTNTIFEGIKMNTITLAASYYFMRNVKGTIELNYDLLDEDPNPNYVGHVTREGYVLAGFDASF